MGPYIVAGSASQVLARAVARRLGVEPVGCELERFPDGEIRPTVTGVRDADVYVVQSTGPPVDEHLVELLLLLDACRRAGAARLTAVVPYFGYARQDRRNRPGQAVGARLAADLIATAGATRLVVVDPHPAAFEAIATPPTEILSAVPVLAGALRPGLPDDAVVVAPDLGAVKLAESYARQLDRPVAIVRKNRLNGTAVHAVDLVGDLDGRTALIVDDMITTGGTIAAATELCLQHGARPGLMLAASHGVLVGDAGQRLAALPVQRLLVSDSIADRPTHPQPVEVCSIAATLAATIGTDDPIATAVRRHG